MFFRRHLEQTVSITDVCGRPSQRNNLFKDLVQFVEFQAPTKSRHAYLPKRNIHTLAGADPCKPVFSHETTRAHCQRTVGE